MKILIMKTEYDEASLGLVDGGKLVSTVRFPARGVLSYVLLDEIAKFLKKNKMFIRDLGGIIVYRGPGSFMGLRIVMITANTLAYALGIPISGVAKTNVEEWWRSGLRNLKKQTLTVVLPFYGKAPNISRPAEKG